MSLKWLAVYFTGKCCRCNFKPTNTKNSCTMNWKLWIVCGGVCMHKRRFVFMWPCNELAMCTGCHPAGCHRMTAGTGFTTCEPDSGRKDRSYFHMQTYMEDGWLAAAILRCYICYEAAHKNSASFVHRVDPHIFKLSHLEKVNEVCVQRQQ